MPPLPIHEAEEGTLSIAASATYFGDFGEELSSRASGSPTESTQRSLLGSEDASMGSIICRAGAHLQMDFPQASHALVKAFFRRQSLPMNSAIPPSENYNEK